MKPRMSGIADVARGSLKHGQHVERVHVAVEARHLAGGQVEVVHAELRALANSGSSTSVTLRTQRVSWPRSSRRRCSTS